MIPLSDSTKANLEKLRTKTSDFPGGINPVYEGRTANGWLQRRFFIAFGKSASIQWVDDDSTCQNQHIRYEDGTSPGIHHSYQDTKGQIWILLCPDRLPDDLRARLEADIPQGRVSNRLREAIANRGESQRRKKVESVKQEYLD